MVIGCIVQVVLIYNKGKFDLKTYKGRPHEYTPHVKYEKTLIEITTLLVQHDLLYYEH